MARGGGGGGTGEQNTEIAYLLVAGMLMVLLYALWGRVDHYVIEGALYARWGQLWVLAQLPFIGERFFGPAEATSWAVLQYPMGEDIDLRGGGTATKGEILAESSRTLGRWLFVPAALALGGMAWYVATKDVSARFKRTLSLDAFATFQAKAWKMIAPAVKANPLADKTDKWAEALSPEAWVKARGIEMIDIAPDREAVREALSRQITKPWDGVARLAPHERVLVAIFALKHAQKTNETTEMVGAVADGWARHGSIPKALKLNPGLKSRIDKILADPKLGGEIVKHARGHAFMETAFCNMLDQARKRGGVLASAEFLWLKPENRGLWYVLNNVGRPTTHIEAAGAIAHWKAELASGRPLPEPDVDEAVFGLEEYLARLAQFKPAKTVA